MPEETVKSGGEFIWFSLGGKQATIPHPLEGVGVRDDRVGAGAGFGMTARVTDEVNE